MPDGKIVIDAGELVAQAQAFLAELKREERSEHRIARVVDEMRAYKAAVVMANFPRGHGPDGDSDRLREHREVSRAPDAAIPRLLRWLTTRDGAYLLGGEARWRLDDADWEENVWSPLASWAERGHALLFAGSGAAGWPDPVPPEDLRAWEAEELALELRLLARTAAFVTVGDGIVLDPDEPFTIRWRETPCRLGDNNSFRIMERLALARGRKVSREDIALAISDDGYSDDALRKAVSRLRAKLTQDGLGRLASRLKTSEYGRFVYLAPPPSGEAV